VAVLNKYTVGALVCLAALASIWGYGSYQYHQGVSDTETAARIAAFEHYQSEVERINAATFDLQNRLTELQNEKPKVITQYRDRVIEAPLPDDCRIDDGRLRDIQSGLDAARAAR